MRLKTGNTEGTPQRPREVIQEVKLDEDLAREGRILRANLEVKEANQFGINMRPKGKYQDADFPMGSMRENINGSTFQSEGATHTKGLRQLCKISFEKQQCSQLG